MKNKFMWFVMVWYVLGFTLDEISSVHFPMGYETNPDRRDIAGHFVWAHAAAQDWIFFALMLSIGFILYYAVRRVNENLGQLAFAGWLLVHGVGGYTTAVQNTWIRLGWVVKDSMLR